MPCMTHPAENERGSQEASRPATPAAKEGGASPDDGGLEDRKRAYTRGHADGFAQGQREVVAPGAAQPVADKETEWLLLREYLGDTDWTTSNAFTYRQFFCWGWERCKATAAPEGWRGVMEMALGALQKSVDNFPANVQHQQAITALRAALNREVEPRTVRMPLKEEQKL
jgi:hypothetical protein